MQEEDRDEDQASDGVTESQPEEVASDACRVGLRLVLVVLSHVQWRPRSSDLEW